MASLLYLKHIYALSDGDTVERWSENPVLAAHQRRALLPAFTALRRIEPGALAPAHRRGGCEWLLAQSIEAAKRGRVVKRASLDTVVLDTAVQLKAIAHTTDSRLLNRARKQLVRAAQDAGIELRQSYARVGRAAEHQVGRYAHARQYRRMQREIKRLRTWLCRVIARRAA